MLINQKSVKNHIGLSGFIKLLLLAVCLLNAMASLAASPQINTTPATTAQVNQIFQYMPLASDSDGDPLSWKVSNLSVLPGWLKFYGSSQNSIVSTLAGTGVSGDVNGDVSVAQFSYPAGLAIDSQDNIYLSEYYSNKIKKITPSGNVSIFVGSDVAGDADGTGSAALFRTPRGLVVDSNDNLYVVDTGNNKIKKVTPAGVVTTFAGSGQQGKLDGSGTSASFNNPRGITIDKQGNLYVADSSNYLVRKITPAGDVTTFAGSGVSGNIDGTATQAQFAFPRDLVVDNDGNVYVSDYGNHNIRKITPAGNVTTFAGSGVAGNTDGLGSAAQFNGPIGIAIDRKGDLYVADTNNHSIRKLTKAGDVSTLAGTGSAGFNNGDASLAQFSSPYRLVFDQSNTMVLADTDNHRIRKITLPPVLIGQPTCSDISANDSYPLSLTVSDGVNTVQQTLNINVSNDGSCTVRVVTHNNSVSNGFQDIYNLALDGDVLEMDDGVYTIDSFDLSKALTIVAKNPGKVTIVGSSGSVGSLIFRVHRDTVFRGIHFSHAGRAIELRDDDARIVFENVVFSGFAEDALTHDNSTTGTIGSVEMRRVVFNDMPRAISINDGGTIKISNALFHQITADLASVAGANEGSKTLEINNYVVSNSASSQCSTSSASFCTLNNALTETRELGLPYLVMGNDRQIHHLEDTPVIDKLTDFGNVHVGKTKTLSFGFSGANKWTSAAVSGTAFTLGNILQNSNILPFTVDESALDISFVPTTLGASTATLSLQNGSDTYQFTITGNGINAKPVVVDDTGSLNEDAAATAFDVLLNDSDADNDPLTIQAASLLSGQGSVNVASNKVNFTPASNFNGAAQLSYTVSDGIESAQGVLNLTVIAVADPPVAVDDTAEAIKLTPKTINVLANDSDPDGDTLTITSATLTSGSGTLSFNSSTITFTPNTGQGTFAQITYQVSDGTFTRSAVVNITIRGNNAPVAVADSVTINEDNSVDISPLNNDTDADNDPLTIVSAQVDTGTVSITTNQIHYIPPANYHGIATINYTISDGFEQASSTVNITINPVNDLPTGTVDIVGAAKEGVTLTIGNTLADNDGLGTFAYQWFRNDVNLPGATNNSYLLTQSDVGSKIHVQVSYTDGDGNNESVNSAKTLAIANVNDAPTGSIDIVGTAQEDNTLTINNTLADQDGLGTFNYQWLADGVAITGATAATYSLSQKDVGK